MSVELEQKHQDNLTTNVDINPNNNSSKWEKHKAYHREILANKKYIKNKTINKNYPINSPLPEGVCIHTENLVKIIANKDKRYDLIKGVNLDIYNGDFMMILGTSGSGKTTLLSLLSALDRPSEGNVNILGYNTAPLKISKLIKLRNYFIGYIFQQYGLLKEVSVLENILVTLDNKEQNKILKINHKFKKEAKKITNDFKKLNKIYQKIFVLPSYFNTIDLERVFFNAYIDQKILNEINLIQVINQYQALPETLKERITKLRDQYFDGIFTYEMMKKLEIDHLINHKIITLSGGQQQRVSICRAIVKQPKLLFADEPTGAVDAKTAKKIMEIFKWLNETYHTTIIIVTHNEKLVELSNHIVIIENGKVISNEFNQPKSIDSIDFE